MLERFVKDIDAEDVTHPESVRIMAVQQQVLISTLRTKEDELCQLRRAKEQLRDDRENLRVRLATSLSMSQEHGRTLLLEIPVSMLSGFAINMLTTDFANGLAWAILVVSLVMVVMLRLPDIARIWAKNGSDHA